MTIPTTASGAFTNGFATNVATGITYRNSGQFTKIVNTATNYNATITDNAIMFRGTTAGMVTTFLPAASLVMTNGFTLTIKDAQRSASTTNIVIFPNGTDTINNTTNHYINVDGGSIDLILNATVKNWNIK